MGSNSDAYGNIQATVLPIFDTAKSFITQANMQAFNLAETQKLFQSSPTEWAGMVKNDPEALNGLFKSVQEIYGLMNQYGSAIDGNTMRNYMSTAAQKSQVKPGDFTPHPDHRSAYDRIRDGVNQASDTANRVGDTITKVGSAVTAVGVAAKYASPYVNSLVNGARGYSALPQTVAEFEALPEVMEFDAAAGGLDAEMAGMEAAEGMGADLFGGVGFEAGAEAGVGFGVEAAGAQAGGYALIGEGVAEGIFSAAAISEGLGVSTAVATGIVGAAAVGVGIAAAAAVGGIAYGIYRAAGGTEDLGDIFSDVGNWFSSLV